MTTTSGVAASITVASQSLGAIEVRPETIITACEPLAGFPACVSYALDQRQPAGTPGQSGTGGRPSMSRRRSQSSRRPRRSSSSQLDTACSSRSMAGPPPAIA
jgi:hypothetical protein